MTGNGARWIEMTLPFYAPFTSPSAFSPAHLLNTAANLSGMLKKGLCEHCRVYFSNLSSPVSRTIISCSDSRMALSSLQNTYAAGTSRQGS